MRILGIDLSLRCTGFAIQDGDSICRFSYVETKKDKSKKIRVGNDDHRRCREILEVIESTITVEAPDIIGIEMPTGSQSARGAKAAGLVIGLVAGIDFLSVTPMEVKKALCGNKRASKEEMIEEAISISSINFPGIKKSAHEHIADAVGVIQAIKRLDEYKMIERAVTARAL